VAASLANYPRLGGYIQITKEVDRIVEETEKKTAAAIADMIERDYILGERIAKAIRARWSIA